MNGFTDDQIIEIRRKALAGIIINVLAVTAQQIAANSGQIEAETLEAFIQQVTLKKI
jgi:hypothetical protein